MDMDYIEQIKKVISKNNLYRVAELLDISKLIYKLEANNVMYLDLGSFCIEKFIVTMDNGAERSCLIKFPSIKNIETIKKCILFFHGSQDLNWDVALMSTNMLSDDFITVYLQGNNQGTASVCEPHLHSAYGWISYGENYFEIRDCAPNFQDDLDYVRKVKEFLQTKYGFTDFYAVGHSNGGVFVTLFPIYMPDDFVAIVSHQGGIGWDEWFNLPFEKINEETRKTPIYFYTGTEDIHKIPCIQAHQLFTNEGFDSKIYIEEGGRHMWDKKCENNIYEYLYLH